MGSILSFLAGAVTFVLSQTQLLAFIPKGVVAAVGVVGAMLTALGIRSASSTPSSVLDLLNSLGKGWKTAAGIVVAIVSVLLSPDVSGILSANVAHVVTVIGEVLAAVGLYHASAASAPPAK
jgi:hypothetical protein